MNLHVRDALGYFIYVVENLSPVYEYVDFFGGGVSCVS